MSSIIGLTLDPALVREDCDTNLVSGDRSVLTYECVSRESAETKKQELLLAGAMTVQRRSTGNGNWEVTGTFSFDPAQPNPSVEPPQSVHELDVGIAQPNVFTNLVLLEVFAAKYGSITLASKKLGLIASIVDDYNKGEFPKGEAGQTKAEAKIAEACPGFPAALELFQGVAYRKVDTFLRFDTVYRRTLTAATPQQVTASYEGANKIWTSAEIELFDGLPNDWWFSLPANMQWLKGPPQVNTVAGVKTQISYSYTGALSWWVLEYQPYASAVLFGTDRI